VARQAAMQDPSLLLGGGEQTVLGSLGQPGGGAITQQTFGPGGPGATQTVPPSMDLSQYATGQPPPTLATVGAPPRVDPMRQLMATNPDAAAIIMRQQQDVESFRLKQQENRLTMGEKAMDFLGRGAQGVTDQASLDAFRTQLQSIGLGQYASQLPQFYSQEALARLQAQALSVKEGLQARIEQQKVQALVRGQDVDLLKLQQQGGKLNYQTDADGTIVAVPEYANGTTLQARPVLGANGQPIKSLEGQKLTQQQQTQIRTQENELRTHVDKLLTDYYTVRDSMGRIEASGTEPSAAGDLALITAFMKMLDPSTGVRDVEFKNAATAGGFLEQVKARIGYVQSGQRLSDEMRNDLLTRSRKLYEQYEKDYGQVKQQYRDLTTRLGGNPANVVLETGSTAAKASTTGKPVAQMSREELLAERDRLRKGGS
jgi:hypothetical protein